MAGKQALPPFKTLLRHHRLAANLTQEALAERSGLSVEAVSACACPDLLQNRRRHIGKMKMKF